MMSDLKFYQYDFLNMRKLFINYAVQIYHYNFEKLHRMHNFYIFMIGS